MENESKRSWYDRLIRGITILFLILLANTVFRLYNQLAEYQDTPGSLIEVPYGEGFREYSTAPGKSIQLLCFHGMLLYRSTRGFLPGSFQQMRDHEDMPMTCRYVTIRKESED